MAQRQQFGVVEAVRGVAGCQFRATTAAEVVASDGVLAAEHEAVLSGTTGRLRKAWPRRTGCRGGGGSRESTAAAAQRRQVLRSNVAARSVYAQAYRAPVGPDEINDATPCRAG